MPPRVCPHHLWALSISGIIKTVATSEWGERIAALESQFHYVLNSTLRGEPKVCLASSIETQAPLTDMVRCSKR